MVTTVVSENAFYGRLSSSLGVFAEGNTGNNWLHGNAGIVPVVCGGDGSNVTFKDNAIVFRRLCNPRWPLLKHVTTPGWVRVRACAWSRKRLLG